MLLRIVVVFILCYTTGLLAEKNFLGNDICNSHNDCTGQKSCHPEFGCTIDSAIEKMVVVKLGYLAALIYSCSCCIGVCVCIRCLRWAKQRTVVAPNNDYVTQSVVDINAANHNLLDNSSANMDNPPPYCQHQQMYTPMNNSNIGNKVTASSNGVIPM